MQLISCYTDTFLCASRGDCLQPFGRIVTVLVVANIKTLSRLGDGSVLALQA